MAALAPRYLIPALLLLLCAVSLLIQPLNWALILAAPLLLTALWDYRETLTNIPGDQPTPHIQVRDKIERVDRLIEHYRKSYFALDRLGIM